MDVAAIVASGPSAMAVIAPEGRVKNSWKSDVCKLAQVHCAGSLASA